MLQCSTCSNMTLNTLSFCLYRRFEILNYFLFNLYTNLQFFILFFITPLFSVFFLQNIHISLRFFNKN